MNLEILYMYLSIQEDPDLSDKIANHLVNTVKYLARNDSTWYHIAEFDESGTFLRNRSGQGERLNSVWTRGQVWSIYGFILAYKATRDIDYLLLSIDTYEKINQLNDEKSIYNWDLSSDILAVDLSSSTILSSALIDLYLLTKNEKYLKKSIEMLNDLVNDWMFRDTNNFIFGYSVGNLPRNTDVSEPLSYSDYYFLESLWKLNQLSLEIISF